MVAILEMNKFPNYNLMLLEDGRVVCFTHAAECGLPTKPTTNSEALSLVQRGAACVFCGDPYRCRGVTPPLDEDDYLCRGIGPPTDDDEDSDD
jgi:hypothetical protein